MSGMNGRYEYLEQALLFKPCKHKVRLVGLSIGEALEEELFQHRPDLLEVMAEIAQLQQFGIVLAPEPAWASTNERRVEEVALIARYFAFSI